MSVYEEVEIEDLDFVSTEQVYYYPCPCGDKFAIRLVSFSLRRFECLVEPFSTDREQHHLFLAVRVIATGRHVGCRRGHCNVS
jgi:hypothetical protein